MDSDTHMLPPYRSSTLDSTPRQQQPPRPDESGQERSTKRRRRDGDGSSMQRQRVTRACDRCKRRKVRCTGVRPCEHCIEAGTSCTYELLYTRGRAPSIPSVYDDADRSGSAESPISGPAKSRADDPEQSRRDGERGHGKVHTNGLGNGPARTSLPSFSSLPSMSAIDYPASTSARPDYPTTTSAAAPAAGDETNTSEPASRLSPEPPQTDRQGHYVGPSSGVSFLLRVQKRLHDNISFQRTSSSVFTFGDAPLPESDASFPLLLTRATAVKLCRRYFDFAVVTHRFLHQQTVEAWLDDFYESKGRMLQREDGRAQAAVLFMVFAQARDYLPPAAVDPDMDTSAQYFLAAEQQLSKEWGSVRLASVQARLCQCYYLLAQSRINHCWSLFGTTAHLGLAIGLNRNRRAYPSSSLDHIDIESRRRTFWCAYNLDNYLSSSLGRPRTFHDEDIDQELPVVADDADILRYEIRTNTLRGQSVMLAPVAHIRLSKVISKILRNLYSISPISPSSRASLTAQFSDQLEAWRKTVRFLDADSVSASLLIPIFQRQRNVLNLSYWHAQLLTHRPLLLNNFAYLQHQSASDAQDQAVRAQAKHSISMCLDAAMKVIKIVDDLFQTNQLFQAYWHRSDPPEAYREQLSAAISCQAQIAHMAEKGSLTQRYALVLEELRLVTQRQTEFRPAHSSPAASRLSGSVSIGQQTDSHGRAGPRALDASGDLTGGSSSFSGISNVLSGGLGDWNESPSSSLADATSWGHFDSMVSSGFWPLDSLVSEDLLLRTA